MKTPASISCLFFAASCISTEGMNTQEIGSDVEKCLMTSLSEYYNHEALIVELLAREGFIDDTKESYALLCNQMFSDSLGHYDISADDRTTLEFMDAFGPHALIFQCGAKVLSNPALTQNQKEFYNWFRDSGQSGSMDTEHLSNIITKMSDEEFNHNGIRQTTLFFCAHEIIRNHYLN